jgi:predicted O-methyltransferase YrrM
MGRSHPGAAGAQRGPTLPHRGGTLAAGGPARAAALPSDHDRQLLELGVVRARSFITLEHYHPRNYAHGSSTVRAELEGARHRAPARRLFPELAPEPMSAARDELAPHHGPYSREISTPEYAISLELAAFLLVLCRRRRPTRIVDLGSGFSSFVFRLHRAQVGGDISVWSVDDDPAWLGRTAEYLRRHGLATDRLVGVEEFLTAGERGFDLVVHDLNAINSPARAALLPTALELGAPAGTIVIDDLNGYPYRSRVRAACRRAGARLVNLRSHLLDDRRRYPGAVVRLGPSVSGRSGVGAG